MFKADSDISQVKGIGEKKAAIYKKLGIHTVRQLLLHLPRGYIDLTRISEISKCEIGSRCLIKAQIVRKHGEQRIRKGLSLFKVEVSDGDVLTLTFFNTRFAVEALRTGESYLFYGQMGGTLLRREMNTPMIVPQRYLGGLMPIYPVCAGISSKVVAQDIQRALSQLSSPIEDNLQKSLIDKSDLPELSSAVKMVHSPKTIAEYQLARRRIVFEELLVFSCILLKLRSKRNLHSVKPMQRYDLSEFYSALPFEPTNGQKQAIADIQKDMCSGLVMNRLVQGDVGSGKTMVAAAAAYLAWKNGRQTALMAPTELLAEQHSKTLFSLLSPLGIKTELVTGSMTAKQRRQANERLLNHECDVVVGTHALISKSTCFANLGLVITDEQHRFGVGQRAAIAAKGEDVHTLVMSATPIPRTLSLIIYGDLDVSLIKELPPGRSPVETYRIDSPKRRRALGFIRDRIDEGRQAYIVCPLVAASDAENEQGELLAATDYSKMLSSHEFKNYTVGLLHGRMKPAEKEKVMERFAAGEIKLLVATTVIEVGVDVPNAAVMMIENAERFGLSQLHQLRGRVGRGQHQSYCILLTDNKNELTAQRLKALADTNDGFKIAEEDLRLRGPGDILGARQHGLPILKNADLACDTELVTAAQKTAQELLHADPDLAKPQNSFIAKALREFLQQIGDNPN